MGHHAQQALLGLKAVDQGFVLLTQNQQLVFELQLALGAAAIELGGFEAETQVADDLVLLPARHPAPQLLKNTAASKDLFGGRLKLDQCGCNDQTVEL